MSSNTIIVDTINRKTMSTAVQEYRWTDDLEVHERAALSCIMGHVKNKRILDIGVGAGRTVKGLREISDNYVGVDYVREMVDHCRGRYPGVRFELADARDMSQFADASFELIVFACNGICMVNHTGRLQVLREVHRLLTPGGFFVFSTSNIKDPRRNRFLELPRFEMSRNPVKAVVRGARFVSETGYRLFNRMRLRHHEVRAGDYEILNGKSHHYRTMIYFIGLEGQRRQLEQVGFQPNAAVFDLSGRFANSETKDGTLTFLARK